MKYANHASAVDRGSGLAFRHRLDPADLGGTSVIVQQEEDGSWTAAVVRQYVLLSRRTQTAPRRAAAMRLAEEMLDTLYGKHAAAAPRPKPPRGGRPH